MGKHKKYTDPTTGEEVKLKELAKRYNISYYVLWERLKTKSVLDAVSYEPPKFRNSKHPLKPLYLNMVARCHKVTHSSYSQYGAKGIKVCDRWLDKESGFEKFLQDMGPRPSNKHQIDRIDSTRGYSPENCRWVTTINQSINRRKFRNNKSGFKGVSEAKYRRTKKWRAAIAFNKKDIVIGYFETKEDAARAYDKKALELYGEFAQLNFPL